MFEQFRSKEAKVSKVSGDTKISGDYSVAMGSTGLMVEGVEDAKAYGINVEEKEHEKAPEISFDGRWLVVGDDYIQREGVSHFSFRGNHVSVYGIIPRGCVLLNLVTDEAVVKFKRLMSN